MATYYPREYWNRSSEERLREAERTYLAAKFRLEGSRQRLQPHVVKVVIASSIRSVDIWTGQGTEEPVTTDWEENWHREHRRRQYLLDLQHYLEAAAELDRLQRERALAVDVTQGKWAEWQHQALVKTREATEKARRQRDRASLAEVLEGVAMTQLVGVEDDPTVAAAKEMVTQVTGELEGKADDRFRHAPSAANLTGWLEAEADRQAVGDASTPGDLLAGARRDRPSGPYVTQPGDSLSKIAKRVYGAEHYWRAIYFDNLQTLTNPDHLPIGATLVLR